VRRAEVELILGSTTPVNIEGLVWDGGHVPWAGCCLMCHCLRVRNASKKLHEKVKINSSSNRLAWKSGKLAPNRINTGWKLGTRNRKSDLESRATRNSGYRCQSWYRLIHLSHNWIPARLRRDVRCVRNAVFPAIGGGLKAPRFPQRKHGRRKTWTDCVWNDLATSLGRSKRYSEQHMILHL
jgi:hypothetical protein